MEKNPDPKECRACDYHGKHDLIQGNSFGPQGFNNKELWHWECPNCGETTTYLRGV